MKIEKNKSFICYIYVVCCVDMYRLYGNFKKMRLCKEKS